MLNLVPQHEPEVRRQECPEPVMRLASVRQALRLVSGSFTAGPEDDLDEAVLDFGKVLLLTRGFQENISTFVLHPL